MDKCTVNQHSPLNQHIEHCNGEGDAVFTMTATGSDITIQVCDACAEEIMKIL